MSSVMYSGMRISFLKNRVHCLAQNFSGIHSSFQCIKHYHSISVLCCYANLLFRSFCFHVSIRLTNFMEHSCCWDPDSNQLVKKFPFCIPNVHLPRSRNPSNVSSLQSAESNPHTPSFFKIHFIIVTNFMLGSSGFLTKIFITFLILSMHVTYQ